MSTTAPAPTTSAQDAHALAARLDTEATACGQVLAELQSTKDALAAAQANQARPAPLFGWCNGAEGKRNITEVEAASGVRSAITATYPAGKRATDPASLKEVTDALVIDPQAAISHLQKLTAQGYDTPTIDSVLKAFDTAIGGGTADDDFCPDGEFDQGPRNYTGKGASSTSPAAMQANIDMAMAMIGLVCDRRNALGLKFSVSVNVTGSAPGTRQPMLAKNEAVLRRCAATGGYLWIDTYVGNTPQVGQAGFADMATWAAFARRYGLKIGGRECGAVVCAVPIAQRTASTPVATAAQQGEWYVQLIEQACRLGFDAFIVNSSGDVTPTTLGDTTVAGQAALVLGAAMRGGRSVAA